MSSSSADQWSSPHSNAFLPRGIIPPMVTPLADRETLDDAGLARLVDHILAGGVHGLFILGTTGEGPSLSYHLRCELIDRTCELVDGRVPVLVGISDSSFVESVNLAYYAADAGAAAVVAAPPFYFPADQPELERYARHLAAEVPLPLFLYNMPSHTKLWFDVDTIGHLLDESNIVGLKDSSADMIYFHKVRRHSQKREDFTLLIGPEELLGESLLLGGHGGVCGGANLFPRLYVALHEAASRGDTDRVSLLHAKVMDVTERLYTVAQGGAAVTKGIKTALALLGICCDVMAEPFESLQNGDRSKVARHLETLAPLLDERVTLDLA